jgi:hypothetical protein
MFVVTAVRTMDPTCIGEGQEFSSGKRLVTFGGFEVLCYDTLPL